MLRLTESQLQQREARLNSRASSSAPATQKKAKPRPKHTPGAMNKTEARYQSEVLEHGVRTGVIRRYAFEAIKLRLAAKTFYTPDFMVINETTNEIELHEVKGYWMDDARVKIKVAAAQFPEYRFIAIQHKKGEWSREEF